MDLKTIFIWFVLILDGIMFLIAIAWIITGGWHRKKPFDIDQFRSSLSRDDRINDQFPPPR